MAKITLDDITSSYASTSLFQANFTAIETEFNDKVLYRVNPVGEANQMENNLDMNSNDVLNVNAIDVQEITLAGLPVLATLQSYVDACIVQVGLAEDQVTLATAQADLATAQAVLAQASADAALVSENNAATTLDTFQDIFWGAYASEPALSPVGNPATEGDQYFNTTDNNMLVFNGTIWQVTSSAVTGVRNETTYTASAGVSTFAIIYDLGFVDVYVNGVKLIQDVNYTALTGTDITLTVPLTLATDTLQAVAYSTVEFGDFGTAAFVDTGTAADQVPTNADVRNPRNRIVNPSMAISQENGDATLPVSSGAVYGRDEWFSATNDGAFDASTESLAGSNSLRLTTTTATTNLTGGRTVFSLVHSMEAQNIFDLNGGDIVVQMALNVNWTGDLSFSFVNGDASRSYIHNEPVTPSTTSVQFTIPLEAATVSALDNSMGLRITVGGNNEGSRSTSTVGAWVAGNFVTSDTSTQWTKTINNYVEITNVDLYAGNVPREFQPNSYAYDLAECQRYGFAPLNNAGGTGVIDNGYFTASTAMRAVVKPPVPMRTDSVVVSSSGSFTVYKGGNVSVSSITLDSGRTTANSVVLSVSTVAGASTNDAGALGYGSTSAKMFISARL
jgi:hypothetical protein